MTQWYMIWYCVYNILTYLMLSLASLVVSYIPFLLLGFSFSCWTMFFCNSFKKSLWAQAFSFLTCLNDSVLSINRFFSFWVQNHIFKLFSSDDWIYCSILSLSSDTNNTCDLILIHFRFFLCMYVMCVYSSFSDWGIFLTVLGVLKFHLYRWESFFMLSYL
jgi:hypothetical protein